MIRNLFLISYLSEQESAETEEALINVQIETTKKLVNKTENPNL